MIAVNWKKIALISLESVFLIIKAPRPGRRAFLRRDRCVFCVYIHTCMHTYIHSVGWRAFLRRDRCVLCVCIHTCMHTYIHSYIALSGGHFCNETDVFVCVYTYMHAYIHTYSAHSWTGCVHLDIHEIKLLLHTHACIRIHTYMRIQTCIQHTCIHAYTYMHTCVHTYIHTYIHTYSAHS